MDNDRVDESGAAGTDRRVPSNSRRRRGILRTATALLTVLLLSVAAAAVASPALAGTAGPGYTIGPFSGDNQTASAGQPFPEPLIMYVTDDNDSPAPDIPLTFTVEQGSARFPGGASSITVPTDSAGHAATTLTAGSTPGRVRIVVTTPNFPNPITVEETIVAASSVRVVGSGTLPLGNENATFSLDLTSSGTSASGTCQLTGQTTNVRCTSFSDFRRSGRTVTFRGTGVYNNRQPISFTAQVTDGNPDSFVIFGAGQRFGGNLTSGNITIT